jgi:hypothetical protein
MVLRLKRMERRGRRRRKLWCRARARSSPYLGPATAEASR